MDYSCTTSESLSTEKISSPTTMIRLYKMGSGGSSVEPESRKLPSSKYKGVVPQPNGRWGAQIYEKHKRVWLGTFNEEEEAAISYDIAARRFRGHDAVTNFKSPIANNDQNDPESDFIAAHSKSEIVDMLRKHTYAAELEQNKRKFVNRNGLESNDGVLRKRKVLFEKVLTPSDVGKLNRLVIPKQYAEKHFPLHTEMMTSSASPAKGVLMNLEDRTGKVWRFRYCYWRSSQSYVLTKGWNRFVKENNLGCGDLVCFERSSGLDRQLYIDWKIRSGLVQNVVRLFGVNIVDDKRNDVGGKKRSREVDLFELGCSKKQLIINAL